MKIMIINALVNGGGTEVQTKREVELLKKREHEIFLLTFDYTEREVVEGNHANFVFKYKGFERILRRIMGDAKLENKIKACVNEFKPDIVHINNLQDNFLAVLRAVKNVPVIKTIRDPGLICPLGTCLKANQLLCTGFKENCCVFCIKWKLNYQLLNLCMSFIRKKYLESIQTFICPSEHLSDLCTCNGIPTIAVNNPFDFRIIKKKEITMTKNFLYYGVFSKIKGAVVLIEAFKNFRRKHIDSRLFIVGKISADQSLEKLREEEKNGIYYLGVKTQEEIMELYKKIYCVVVPSLWLENYPNTVLEAIACHTLVIGSNRGGIPELIQNDEFCFDPTKSENIQTCLERVYCLDEKMVKKYTDDAFLRVSNNNTLDAYYNNLMFHVGKTIEKKANALKID